MESQPILGLWPERRPHRDPGDCAFVDVFGAQLGESAVLDWPRRLDSRDRVPRSSNTSHKSGKSYGRRRVDRR